MIEITVGELAKSINAPVERLLKQMKAAGLLHTSAEAKVSEEEKQHLLNFLKSSHGDVALESKRVNSAQLEIEELTDPLIPGQAFTGRVRGFDDGNVVISTAELGVPVKIENGFFSGVWPQIEEGKIYPAVGGSIKITLSQSARALTVEKRIEPPYGFAAVFLKNPIIGDPKYPTANLTIDPVSGDQILYVASECIIYPDGRLTCKDPITTKIFHRVEKTGVFYEYNLTINGGLKHQVQRA